MSARAMEHFARIARLYPRSLITAEHWAIGTYIADLYHPRRGFAWPTPDEIAAACALSVRTTQRRTAELVQWGLLTRRRRMGYSTTYRLPGLDGEPTREGLPIVPVFTLIRGPLVVPRDQETWRNRGAT